MFPTVTTLSSPVLTHPSMREPPTPHAFDRRFLFVRLSTVTLPPLHLSSNSKPHSGSQGSPLIASHSFQPSSPQTSTISSSQSLAAIDAHAANHPLCVTIPIGSSATDSGIFYYEFSIELEKISTLSHPFYLGFDIFGIPDTKSLNWSIQRRARSCGNSPSSSLGLPPSSISTIVVRSSSPFMES
ncbi:hypothetical protein LR48_Vigan10g217300 [Vigna angularis]|uniref:Uncharacterized protein n=1 Tax=Phaseolus angularis TaxID=3914 RepID=A0A0L9VMI2_PHAAN|nr:hypothetical protein LR48_Vigan10g217300 [Vigna angularis]